MVCRVNARVAAGVRTLFGIAAVVSILQYDLPVQGDSCDAIVEV